MRWMWMCILLMCCCVSMAQSATLSGRVVDATHDEPLYGVNITIGNSGKGTISGLDGSFSLELPEGEQRVVFTYVGYEPYVLKLSLEGSGGSHQLGDVELKMGIELATYYFTAYVPDNYSQKYKGSNSTVSLEALRFMKPMGTEEALRSLPGVTVSGDMGISNRLNVGIRGSYPRRAEKILLLEDGTPIAPAPYLSPAAYYNPPTERLDGIEVIKGADILAFGGNTMHGVVNYITRKPPSTPQLNANISSGSHDLHSQYLTYGGTWDKVSSEIQFLHKYFGGFQDNSASRILNGTAKVLNVLDTRNRVYFKLNYHHERSKATYSGLTPYTFEADPTQNPFDSDDLLTNRFAMDLAHTYSYRNLTLSTKLFGHQFTRDWWRQDNTVVRAADVMSYLGEDIFHDRYSYLEDNPYGDDDMVRVGKISGSQESTKARNRVFRVAGLQERLDWDRTRGAMRFRTSAGLDYHVESFENQEIRNSTSRFSRSGDISLDKRYLLHSIGAFAGTRVEWNGFAITPQVRYEWVKMSSLDILAVANDPNNTGKKGYGKDWNTFSAIIPGVQLAHEFNGRHDHALFAGLYKGFTPPTSGYGFLSVDDGTVSQPGDNEHASIGSETSINFDLGYRTNLKAFSGQISYFNNHIRNFYAAGRKEAFQSLGSVTLQGLEFNMDLDILELIGVSRHSLNAGTSVTWLHSRITGGTLNDSDLLKAAHNEATIGELIGKINEHRDGFIVHAGDELLTGPLDTDDFGSITSIDMVFGKGGITGYSAPYNPDLVLSGRLKYVYADMLHVGFQFNHVGKQYTEYLNFRNETSEGAIGRLEAYTTLDINMGYQVRFNRRNPSRVPPSVELFLTGKNVTGKVYKASRLHRLSSGIMPGGFRHFQGGVKLSV